MVFKKLFSYLVFLIAFLLPLAVVPIFTVPVLMGKQVVSYFLILAAFVLWLFLVLKRGSISFPKSGLLLSLGVFLIALLLSSLFSSNPLLSLVGDGGQAGTFAFFLLMGLLLFMSSVVFQNERRLIVLYSLFFASALIVFAFQFLQTFLKIRLLPSIFPLSASNPVGSWNDVGIFFGFVALTSLSLFELAEFPGKIKGFLLAILAISLLMMLSVNFYFLWIIFGLVVLALFSYVLSKTLSFGGTGEKAKNIDLARPSLAVLILAVIFIFTQGLSGFLPSFLGINMIDVVPSWSSTVTVVKRALAENIFFGSGPATFSYDWMRFKPKVVNLTPFWGARFQSGFGYLPSMLASIGVFGGIALLVFLALILFYGFKIFSSGGNGTKKSLLASLYFGIIYLWAFTVFASPGFVVFALAFLLTGALAGMLASSGKIKIIEINYVNNQTIGFVSILCVIFLLVGSVYSLYLVSKKGFAEYYYLQALRKVSIEGNLNSGIDLANKAIHFDRQDKYFRALADMGVLSINKLLSQKSDNVNFLRFQIQKTLSFAVSNAQAAVKINPQEPLNWIQLARIYESVVPFKVEGAEKVAVSTYEEALKRSPLDPSIYLGMARVKINANNFDEAKEFLQSAIQLKGDYVPALYLLAQIEARKGNLKEAIAKTQQALLAAPNDIGVLFQLGLLYYQSKNYELAKEAFERIVAAEPNFSNARYFLGIIYDKEGSRDKAIKQFVKIEKLNPNNKEVKKILENLRSGKEALKDISPPKRLPEDRENPPVSG